MAEEKKWENVDRARRSVRRKRKRKRKTKRERKLKRDIQKLRRGWAK